MPETPSYDQEVTRRLGAFTGTFRQAKGGEQSPEVAEMRRNRQVRQKTAAASAGGAGNGSMQFATGRPRDPLFYWKQNNLPYDYAESDELKKIRQYCSDPAEPVWMGDYSFKAIGEVQVGDEVVGWTKVEPGKPARLTRATVLATSRRTAPETVRVTTESGRTWVGTPDHRFANPFFSPAADGSRWRQPEFVNPEVGKVLRHVIDPTVLLTSDKEREVAAWLGGIYDGEGCGEAIGQSRSYNPAVCERIERSLDLLGLPHTHDERNIYIRREGSRKPAKQALVDFLNWTNPTRRTSNALDKRMLTRISGSQDRIVSVEPLGAGEVVSLETTTGTYVVSGFASSNCRLLYISHPVIGSAIDIYSKYPLLGQELTCKDEQLTDFYSDLFFSEEGLNYNEFSIDMGREYWTVGEAWPFGSFNESLGVWEDDELLNPDDVDVQRSPFLKDPRFFIRLPETLREVLTKKSPVWEYQKLMEAYPELQHYASADAMMPVSSILLRQLKFKGDTFAKRGVPILMRAMRSVMQEEMMNAAMDAVADRMYTPLILTKLGASATDLGTSTPWIPTQDDLADFNDSLDMAMAGDFRVLTHHFGISMESVFGREQMPDLGPDFERLEERILQTFGLSKTMLSGASSGQTYAADALNRDLVSQLLTSYQQRIKDHYRQRALVVAEAQEHYDYDVRGGKRYVKMEEILEIDENGEERIIEQPKLLIPDLQMKTMNIADEESQREFLESLRAAGVPISMKTRMVNIPWKLDDEIETTREEQVALAVAEQQTRKAQYQALKAEGLPIPQDLRDDFEPKANNLPNGATEGARVPVIGIDPTVDTPNLAPTQEDIAGDMTAGTEVAGVPGMAVDPNGGVVIPMPGQQSQVPDESNEMREGMPKPAALFRQASRMKDIAAEHYQEPPERQTDDDDKPVDDGIARGTFAAPKVVGMRRHATHVAALKDTPMEEWGDPQTPSAEGTG